MEKELIETVIVDGKEVKVFKEGSQGYPTYLKIAKRKEQVQMSRENRFPGDSHNPLYFQWKMMTDACENPNRKDYKYFGAKGIHVHPDWHFPDSFTPFLDWAHEQGWSEDIADELKLVRIDKSKDFCPENCTFVQRYKNKRIY